MTVKIFKINNAKSKAKAYASVTFGDWMVVTGFRVIEGKNGLFVANPSAKGSDGDYHDTAFPITKEGREMLHKAILEEYKKADKHDKSDGFMEATDEQPFFK